MGYRNRLNYSLGNETWQAESHALAIRRGDAVLCVTASGDRPLHVLLDDPASVLSIDVNPIQNYLLELKIAAIRHCSYSEFLQFLGLRSSDNRIATYGAIQSQLSSPARQFWRKNLKLLEKGVLFQGKTERYCLFVSHFFRILFGSRTRILLAFTSIAAQKMYVEEQWDSAFHRWIYSAAVRMPKLPYVSVFDDPGLHAFIDDAIDPASYMYERKNTYLKRGLASSSLLIQLIYNGGLLEQGLPAYLQESNYALIKGRIDRISMVTCDIAEYLECFPATFDVFSLSDVASYMPLLDYVQTLKSVKARANSASRFCIREYMTRYGIPSELAAHFVRDRKQEERAESLESNFVYRIMAGTIV